MKGGLRGARRVVSLLVAATCVSCGPRAQPLPSSSRHEVEALLDLEAANADVWAWEIALSAKLDGRATLERVPPLFGAPPCEPQMHALDAIAALGVTAGWLSPLFGSRPETSAMR